jgi:NAD(P)-dependent dehydrogenase (short-subunit alcohol dehydrogenase family)
MRSTATGSPASTRPTSTLPPGQPRAKTGCTKPKREIGGHAKRAGARHSQFAPINVLLNGAAGIMRPAMRQLEGKVAIITGGTSGIGAACVERFVAEGARVIVAARREEAGHALERALGEAVLFIRTDVSKESDVEAMVEVTLRRHGHIDCLVNNAGHSNGVQSILDFDVVQFESLAAVHLRGCLLGLKHVGRCMAAQRAGAIVNVASISAHLAGISGHTYAALKAAMVQLTRSVSLELGTLGVRVNSVSPGAIVTGIFGKAAGKTEAEAATTLDGLSTRFAGLQAIPRAGMPVDVARAVAWLASEEAAFVNGADLMIDGAMPGGLAWDKLNALRTSL